MDTSKNGMGKMTKCKSCGAEIAKSAKTCPQCGAKQKHTLKTVAFVLLVIFLIGVFASIFGDSSDPELVQSSAQGTESGRSDNEKTDTETKTVFNVGETAALNDVHVTLVNVSENNGGNYMTPTDGNVFVVCEFEIENNSDTDIAVSSIMSFEAYVDDYSTSMNLSAMLSTNQKQLDGSVAAGKKMNGVIGYEAPSGWSTIEVKFTPDFWSGKDIAFTYSKQ